MCAKKIQAQRFKTGYLDESGDLGKDGSKCLVLTYLNLDEGKKVNKILRKTKELLRKTKKGERWLNRTGGELKFYGFPDQRILVKTIEELAKLQFPIQFIAVYKDGISINPEVKVQILYDLLGQVFNLEELPHKIVADKDYFNNKKVAYLVVQDYEETPYEGNVRGYSCKFYVAEEEVIKGKDNINMLIPIKHENSKNSLGLQVADLVSGAIFQEMENGKKEYTDIMRKHIKINGRVIRRKEEK